MAQKKININTASLEELASLPKISQERAQTLLDERPFDSWEEISDLPGFDDRLIQDIQKSGGYLAEADEWAEEEEWIEEEVE